MVTLDSLKLSGRAPYFSMLARSCASVCVKLPEISALPLSDWATDGSETTSPSRTMANWFCGGCCWASLPVMAANFLEPPDVKSMVTFQPAALCVSKTAPAFLMSVPATSAGPSTYFCHWPEPFWPQATVGSAGLAPSPAVARSALFEQSSAVYAAWSFAVAGSTLPLGVGVGLDEAEELTDGLESAFRASVTARPWEVAVGEGVTEDDEDDDGDAVALSVALSVALELLDVLGEGVADLSAPETSVVSTGRK